MGHATKSLVFTARATGKLLRDFSSSTRGCADETLRGAVPPPLSLGPATPRTDIWLPLVEAAGRTPRLPPSESGDAGRAVGRGRDSGRLCRCEAAAAIAAVGPELYSDLVIWRSQWHCVCLGCAASQIIVQIRYN
ncbi:hypothetical protein R6Z07F_000122 [Ovis aries]